jgi:hypothetical protein
MTYLYWYLGIGALFLAVIFISHQLTKSPADDRIADLLLAADPSSNKWWWKPLNKVVVPILAAIMVLVVWPIAIYWKAKEMIEARNIKEAEPPKEFAVTRDRLLKRWSVGEIEKTEIVSDPMGAAPRLPFGHLNPAWENFKQSIQDKDQLWSFSAPWTSDWGRNEVRDGYVILRGETIGPHFLTRWVILDKENEQGEN